MGGGAAHRKKSTQEGDARCCELFRDAVEEAVMQGIAACSGVVWRKLTGRGQGIPAVHGIFFS
jgi:hypothetical protein